MAEDLQNNKIAKTDALGLDGVDREGLIRWTVGVFGVSVSDAEDIVHTAIGNALSARPDLQTKPTRENLSYLRTSIRHIAATLGRDRATAMRAQPKIVEWQEAHGSSQLDELESKETTVRIKNAVECLPAGYREALTGRYVDGLSDQGLADKLGLSINGARKRIRRAFELLRDELGKEEDLHRLAASD